MGGISQQPCGALRDPKFDCHHHAGTWHDPYHQCPTTPAELQYMSSNRYWELISLLHYVTLATQPYISFAISKLTQFLVNPAQTHLDTALHVLCYLKGMKKWTLNLVGDVANMAGFMDPDWGGDCNDLCQFSLIFPDLLQISGGGRRVPASGEDKHISVSLGVTWRRGTDQDGPYQPPTGRTPIR